MYYEINVSFYGKHYFATSERSITDETHLQHIVQTFADKFPANEGYEITISKNETTGNYLDFHEVLQEARDERNLLCGNYEDVTKRQDEFKKLS
jgi:hypothetical protein